MSTATANGSATHANPWEMEVGSGGSGGDYELCPAGNYPAVIVGLFDVGHQPETNDKGQAIEVRKLIVVYELIKKQSSGKPFVMAEKYTWSMRNNSNFYALACNVTGVQFKEGEKFDPRGLIPVPVMVQVTHGTGKKDPTKKYHNVGSVAQFPDGLPAPAPTIPPASWSVLEGTPLPDTSWVPFVYGQSVRQLVEMSSEWRRGAVPGGGREAGSDDEVPY